MMAHNYIGISYFQNNKRDVRDEKSNVVWDRYKAQSGNSNIYFWEMSRKMLYRM